MKENSKVHNNGSMYETNKMAKMKFPVNSKIWMQTNDYVGEFRVIEAKIDSGTEMRMLSGSGSNFVTPLSYLQRNAMDGNIKFIDSNNNIEENKESK